MANLSWRKAKAKCPFYYTSRDEAITCSCGAGGVKGLKVIFLTAFYCGEWFRRFCAAGYSRCPNHRRIEDEIEKEGSKNG